MNASRTLSYDAGALPMSSVIPIVFIVDDDISVRESLELLIRDQNWKPEMFASAKEFLDQPRKRVPSCLVLDLSLPDLNGLELQKQLVVEQSDMPIIFISGYGDVPKSVQAMKAGALEFLTKPINDEALVNAIRNALQRSRQALQLEMRPQEDDGIVAAGLAWNIGHVDPCFAQRVLRLQRLTGRGEPTTLRFSVVSRL